MMARHAWADRIRVLVVNDAVYPLWGADWLHACDRKWWAWNILAVARFPGIKTTMASDVPAPWVDGALIDTGISGFDPEPSHCRTGGNSGYQGIHIAMAAGAAKVVLVGMDMHRRDGDHFFGAHRDNIASHHATTMIPYFESLVPAARSMGVEILNATPGSALQAFRFTELERELEVP